MQLQPSDLGLTTRSESGTWQFTDVIIFFAAVVQYHASYGVFDETTATISRKIVLRWSQERTQKRIQEEEKIMQEQLEEQDEMHVERLDHISLLPEQSDPDDQDKSNQRGFVLVGTDPLIQDQDIAASSDPELRPDLQFELAIEIEDPATNTESPNETERDHDLVEPKVLASKDGGVHTDKQGGQLPTRFIKSRPELDGALFRVRWEWFSRVFYRRLMILHGWKLVALMCTIAAMIMWREQPDLVAAVYVTSAMIIVVSRSNAGALWLPLILMVDFAALAQYMVQTPFFRRVLCSGGHPWTAIHALRWWGVLMSIPSETLESCLKMSGGLSFMTVHLFVLLIIVMYHNTLRHSPQLKNSMTTRHIALFNVNPDIISVGIRVERSSGKEGHAVTTVSPLYQNVNVDGDSIQEKMSESEATPKISTISSKTDEGWLLKRLLWYMSHIYRLHGLSIACFVLLFSCFIQPISIASLLYLLYLGSIGVFRGTWRQYSWVILIILQMIELAFHLCVALIPIPG